MAKGYFDDGLADILERHAREREDGTALIIRMLRNADIRTDMCVHGGPNMAGVLFLSVGELERLARIYA